MTCILDLMHLYCFVVCLETFGPVGFHPVLVPVHKIYVNFGVDRPHHDLYALLGLDGPLKENVESHFTGLFLAGQHAEVLSCNVLLIFLKFQLLGDHFVEKVLPKEAVVEQFRGLEVAIPDDFPHAHETAIFCLLIFQVFVSPSGSACRRKEENLLYPVGKPLVVEAAYESSKAMPR